MMKLLTDEEYNMQQLALCRCREAHAMCMVRITDFTECGSVSFWLKVRDYWHNKGLKFKIELNKIHEIQMRNYINMYGEPPK